jgi:predicted Zn-dependent protease
MYTRDQAKELTDKVLNMATADAVEVNLTGGERSGTRWANSSITTNLVQYDRQITVTVRLGQKSGSADTRDFSDAGLKTMVDEALSELVRRGTTRTCPSCWVRRNTSRSMPHFLTW